MTTPTSPLRYVYAVCRPFDGLPPDGAQGIAGEPPRLLRHHDLVAVVDAVPAEDFDEGPLRARMEDLDWLAATARAHDAVLAALGTVTSPLPLRLATVCRDDSGVRRLMEEGHDRFVRALDRLDGRVEWGVKVYAEPAPARRPSDAPRPDGSPTPETPRRDGSRTPDAPQPGSAATARDGREYLRRRIQERQGRAARLRRAEDMCRGLHDRLSAYAEAGAVHPPQDPRLSGTDAVNVLNAAYLVGREHGEEFVALVRGASQEGVRVELTGPWAPYSFAGIAEGDA
ncbi:GvpL/GvpF family gas vesicle protein [Streptomyces sp. NPDC047928]|uniref:GvpL/GvpF family gas vesicle protein n=1 Tax=unclassified Streptomyces TaxID=2593676 RepID=UPI003723E309